jgi:V8-like Glu-specific endopeptidase
MTRILPLAVTFALGAVACSSKATPAVTLPSFSDITTAPAPIQKAAQAVVRIATANGLATGSFISPTGLLLTNNHVLGTAVCPVEGCFAQITFNYQRGTKATSPQTVFVVPTAVSAGLDMAVVQVYSSQGGSQLATSSYLTITSRTPAQLEGTHVTLVGHPEGHLKKWTAGEVVDSDGEWVYTTAYLLPGNSGSPLLDDSGDIVGIIHRGPTGEGYFSADGANTFSLGSASSFLSAAMSAPLPPEMVSVQAATTQADVVTNDLVYLNGHVATANLGGGTTVDVLTALGSACDTALAGSYGTPDDLDAALQPCYDALSWIECRADAQSSPGGTECPDATDAALWQTRFTQMNAATVAMNGQTSLDPVSFGVAALQSSTATGLTAGAASLQQVLTAASVPIDFGVANYLAAFAIGQYAGTSTSDYVVNYSKVAGYALDGTDIASSAVWLANNSLIQGSQALSVVQALYTDPSIDVGDDLYIEDILYQSGSLQ